MRLAGLITEPVAMLKAAGVSVRQDDWPWWAERCVTWLRLVDSIYQRSGRQGEIYRGMLQQVLEFKIGWGEVAKKTGRQTKVWGAPALYALYETFLTACKMEDKR